jgi:hypothetical protein
MRISLERCVVIHFLWLKHIPNHVILSELEEIYGKDVMSLRAMEKWAAAFDGGPTELVDLPRSGDLVPLERSTLSVH